MVTAQVNYMKFWQFLPPDKGSLTQAVTKENLQSILHSNNMLLIKAWLQTK